MRIDIHAHYYPTGYLDLLERKGSQSARMVRGLGAGSEPVEMEDRLRMMDDAGIDLQVLSAGQLVPYFETEADAVEAARLANDLFAAVVREYPDRFRSFAVTPLPHVGASIAEMSRALDELGMPGVGVTATVLGSSLADPIFEDFFRELDRRSAVLFVHPAGSGTGEQTQVFGLAWIIGAPFEDTFAALHLVLSGLTTRYPNIRVIIPHLGGTLPFLMQRIDNLYTSRVAGDLSEPPSSLAGRLWYDTVAHGHIPALRCAFDTFGSGRLLLGTDFPYTRWEHFKREVTYIQDSGLPREDIQAIQDENAQDLLGLA